MFRDSAPALFAEASRVFHPYRPLQGQIISLRGCQVADRKGSADRYLLSGIFNSRQARVEIMETYVLLHLTGKYL